MPVNNKNTIEKCELCCREYVKLSFHHLIPKTLHKKKYYKKFTKEKLSSGINICLDCHKAIHDFISEKDLGKKYYNIVLLKSNYKVNNFILWVRKQKRSKFKSIRSKMR